LALQLSKAVEQLKDEFADKLVSLQQQMEVNFDTVTQIINHVKFCIKF
jgi:hypothetical protein